MNMIDRSQMKNSLIVLALLLAVSITLPLTPAYTSQEDRGFKSIVINGPDGHEIDLYKESYALLIGVSNYAKGWPDLRGVRKDIEAFSEVLRRQDFHVVIVEDPTYDQLIHSFSAFINEYGLDPDNRLLFYFSGHGYTATQSYGDKMGYIVPSDAPDPEKDFTGFLQKAVDMHQIEVFAKRIQSRHALFIFDSCFSGSIFSISRAMPQNISYKIAEPVRQFITSGSADEKVPDESVFLQLLLLGVSGEGDLNRDGYVTGTELGSFLQDNVINCTHGCQHPQFGKIRHLNLSRGDFVFLLKGTDNEGKYEEKSSAQTEAWKMKLKKGTIVEKTPLIPLPSF